MQERDFRRLYEDQYTRVYGFLRRRLRDESTARDLTAETFLVAWQKLSEPPEHPAAWLLTVARHKLSNARRARMREEQLVAQLVSHGTTHLARASPLNGSRTDDSTSHGESLRHALGQLSSADQEVLLLVAWEDLDGHGLAQVLGCSVGAARVRLHRARQRLRRLVAIAEIDLSQPEG